MLKVKAPGGQRNIAVIAGFAAALLVFALTIYAAYSQGERMTQYERAQVIMEASSIRATIESSISRRISLERGIAAYFTTNPNRSADDFTQFARVIVHGDYVIKNLTLIEGTTIKYVYPYEGNSNAIGRDLALIPEQVGSIRKAMETNEPVVMGPFDLVQGGSGIASRMGVFPTIAGSTNYWGQVSVVIDSDHLFHEAGLQSNRSIRLALCFKNKSADKSSVFYGDPEILNENPISIDIGVPGIDWTLLVLPLNGWNKVQPIAIFLTLIGITFALISGFMIYGLVSTRADLKQMAYHDQLTGLPNRSLFWDRLFMASNLVDREGVNVCLCIIDLDGFKKVNDIYGHEAGDLLLVAAAQRMVAVMRKSDTVSRFGGDEFAVIATFNNSDNMKDVLAKLRLCFIDPFDLGTVSLKIGASIGTALYPKDSKEIDEVIALADARMYEDKRSLS